MFKFVIILFLAFSFPSMAQENEKILSDIEKYINNLTTAKGTFKQIASSGEYATGQIYLSRPGKIRLDYDAPNNIQLLADGEEFIYYDKELIQVTYLSMDASIAGVLVKDSFSFSNPDFKLEGMSKSDTTINIMISSVADPFSGKIVLIFDRNPLTLVQWKVIDAQGITTTVVLENMEYGIALENNLFIFNDPRHSTDYFNRNRR